MSSAALTINREAGDKSKGFRLQKLRAAKLMLDAIETHDGALIYTAIEVVEDVALTVASAIGTTEYFEEDKNFDADGNFTIHSAPVLNTLVSFFDIHSNHWQGSSNVVLAFYTTAGIGKERKNELTDGTKISLPSTPVLELLQKHQIDSQLATTVKTILIEEYEKQYKDKTTKGHLKSLELLTIEKFVTFLKSIHWFFSEEDEVALKQCVLQKIRDSRLFNFKVANKEEGILSLILERLDERQNCPDLAQRFITSSDIKLVFKEAESEERGDVMDPVWQEMKKLSLGITDKRNLEEKVHSVCAGVSVARIRMMARLACRSKTEQAHSNKSFLALQYRVFEACEEHLCSPEYVPPSTPQELEDLISDLNKKAFAVVAELKNDYTYTVSNSETIKGIVMDLADRCFIAFEKV